MHQDRIHAGTTERRFTITLESGDEVVRALQRFLRDHDIEAAHVSAVGGIQDVVLAHFHAPSGKDLKTRYEEQMEVASLHGTIRTGADGVPASRLQVVLARRDHTTIGGRLLEAHVCPDLDVVLTETPAVEVRSPKAQQAPRGAVTP